MTIHVLDIVPGTTVDGPGLRTSIYVAGCNHACPGCHNPGSWDFGAGHPMTVEEIMDVVREEEFDVTLSGGDPLCSPRTVLPLLQALRRGKFGVWLYTGYVWETLVRRQDVVRCLEYIDVLVDGPYIASLRDTALRFRGSANQRVIDVAASRREGQTVILPY